MTSDQIERLSGRLLNKVLKIEDDEDASETDQDVMVVLMDCVEALDEIIEQMQQQKRLARRDVERVKHTLFRSPSLKH